MRATAQKQMHDDEKKLAATAATKRTTQAEQAKKKMDKSEERASRDRAASPKQSSFFELERMRDAARASEAVRSISPATSEALVEIPTLLAGFDRQAGSPLPHAALLAAHTDALAAGAKRGPRRAALVAVLAHVSQKMPSLGALAAHPLLGGDAGAAKHRRQLGAAANAEERARQLSHVRGQWAVMPRASRRWIPRTLIMSPPPTPHPPSLGEIVDLAAKAKTKQNKTKQTPHSAQPAIGGFVCLSIDLKTSNLSFDTTALSRS